MSETKSGNKYHREIIGLGGEVLGKIDIYSVLDAYNVKNPAVQHAVKKILCAGLRNKGSYEQDMKEAIESLEQASRFVKVEVEDKKHPLPDCFGIFEGSIKCVSCPVHKRCEIETLERIKI